MAEQPYLSATSGEATPKGRTPHKEASCAAEEDENVLAQVMRDTLRESSLASTMAKDAMDKAQALQQQVLELEARLNQVEHSAGTGQTHAQKCASSAAAPATDPPPRRLLSVVGSEHPLFQQIRTAIMDAREASALAEKTAQAVQHLQNIMVSLNHRVDALERGLNQHRMD